MTTNQQLEAEIRLPRPPGVLRRALAAHPRAVDLFIIVWYVIGCGLALLLDFSSATMWDETTNSAVLGAPYYLTSLWGLLSLLRFAVVLAALFYRRKYPLAGLIAIVVAMLGDHSFQTMPNGVALLFLLYAVPVYRSVRAGWVGYGIALGAGPLDLLFPAPDDAALGSPGVLLMAADTEMLDIRNIIGALIFTAVWYLVIVMIGINLGNRRRYLQAVIDRAHQLARERDQLAQLAVAEERSRIAREMHDIVAHSVSVMIALSEGAARAAPTAPQAAAEAMSRSAETGRTALAEMRRMLGALHSADEQQAELVPQPGVQDLPQLVSGFQDAGLDVSLEVSGEAAGDRGQDLAVYRIVQEGLTNVLRYAGTQARAEVHVRRFADRSTVEVRDYGAVAGASAPVQGVGSGRGITGLRERARVFGGEIEAGPVADGRGWLLRADLPVSSAARERPADPPPIHDVPTAAESEETP